MEASWTKTAQEIWRLSLPDGKDLALEAPALEAVSQGLGWAAGVLGFSQGFEDGVLPASETPQGDPVVRQALCPAVDDAIKVDRGTVWCRRMGRVCPNLEVFHPEDGYVVCKAATSRVRAGAQWWQMGGDQGKLPPADLGALSKILLLLGPAAASAYKGWRSKKLGKQLSGPQKDSWSMVSSVLKADAIGYVWDSTLKRFKFAQSSGYIEVHDDGELIIKYPNGRIKKVNLKQRIDALFDLTSKLKVEGLPKAGPFRSPSP